uniref:Uncharacterized protein n=1 Tax=Arundo donax TaxID=35708 RepID=A0A0A9BG63_ARUDO
MASLSLSSSSVYTNPVTSTMLIRY